MNKNDLISIPLTPKMKDLTGLKQGNIIFIKPSKKINNRIYWWVQCNCGNIEQIRSDSKKEQCSQCTKKRVSKSLKNKKSLDLRNQKFEKLTALYPLEQRKNGHVVWHCKCDCGNELDVITSSLTSGNTKSCGCLKKERTFFNQLKENLIGQRFNHLLVLEETPQRQYEKVVWKCKCDCGNIVYLNTTRLKSGNDISCGCQKQSLGILNIIKILKDNHIKYKQEYTESSLLKKKFDFALYNNQQVIRLVEYDGEQHFRITGGWNNEKNFKEGQKRDQQKNQWAKEHNIPLVRIPYWERDNITLDMILGNKYLVDD